MVRFQLQRTKKRTHRSLLSIAAFLIILLLFLSGINRFSETSYRQQKENLEQAISRSITYCYATEGSYPESLEDLKEHYGLTYNEDRFFVDYKVSGSNIYPDVTIIEKGVKK